MPLRKANKAVRRIARGFDESRVGKANLGLQRFVGRALRGGMGDALGPRYRKRMDRRKK